ncbi:MAG: peptide-methionine (S)-S-oxide reductase MsrA [Bacteroidia bacterium]
MSDLIQTRIEDAEGLAYATLGAGCFWCVEAVYQRLDGVIALESGYSGGHVKNPTYNEVCGKKTGHAEVVRIAYDPAKVSYEDLLEVFWRTHDPTTPNQQGNDKGPQYRSVIYYHDDEQKALAEASMNAATEAELYADPIVTEISPLINYYAAEEYHQNYFNDNPKQGYCFYVIGPKVDKFKQLFKDKMKA